MDQRNWFSATQHSQTMNRSCATIAARGSVAPTRVFQAVIRSVFLAIPTYDRNATVAAATGFLPRSEEHTSELQSLMRISYAVFCLKKKTTHTYSTAKSNEHHKIQQHVYRPTA